MRRWGAPTSPFHATPERVERFRADNRVGERISGTFLGWDAPGIGWVNFQGTKLLASMASRPEVGTRLHFLVKQLFPDIILQELSPSGLPGTFPLLQRLWTEQNRLEASLASLWSSVTPGNDHREQAQSQAQNETPNTAQDWTRCLAARLAAWRKLLNQHPEARQVLHRLNAALEPINTELAARGIGRFFALPWLSDRVRGAGLLLGGAPVHPGQRASGTSAPQAVFTCTHPTLGQMEIHFVLPNPHLGPHPDSQLGPQLGPQLVWALHLDLKALPSRTIASVSDWLQRAFSRLESGALFFQGVRPLPPDNHSGLLPRLLLASTAGRPRLHIKV
ncbi:hypothetical protein [Desulfonatronum lacustre]|uniref:hypothetical protein n=1 Tax=Desulfonatronum lacustre TaxID=66849 RepID=UPI00048EECAE|nr:hypothetical protein [Desulfonatronum lacustre]